MLNASKISILKISLLSILLFITNSFHLHPMSSDSADIERQFEEYDKQYDNLKEQYNELNRDYENKIKESEQEYKQYEKEHNSFVGNSFAKKFQELSDTPIFKNFEPTLFHIFSIPIKLGLYWGDLFKFTFMFTDIKIDKYLYNKLKDYYVDYIFDKTINNHEELFSILSKLDMENEKDISQNNNRTNENKINLTTELYEYLKKNQAISIRQILKSSFLGKIALYFTLSEISRISKNTILGERDIVSFKSLWKKFWHTRSARIMSNRPIGLFDFVKSFNFLTKFITKPLTTSTSFFSRGLLEIMQFSYKQEEKKENIPILLKYYSAFMNSYLYIFVKEILVLCFTIKQLDKNMYKRCWTNFIKNNRDELFSILKEYKFIKTKYKKRTKKNELLFQKIEQKLKDFVKKGHDFSFNFWLRHKNVFSTQVEAIVDLIINSPTYFVAGKKALPIAKIFIAKPFL